MHLDRGSVNASFIDPDSVRQLALSIVSPYIGEGRWNWHQPAAIYDWVQHNIQYVPDPRGRNYSALPQETLEGGGGDCEDHAILIASLCEAVGIPARIILCFRPENGHAFCQVRIGKHSQRAVADNVRQYYGSQSGGLTRSIACDVDRTGAIWLPSDTAACRYFGDNSGLESLGYLVRKNGSSDLAWLEPIEIVQLDVPGGFREESGPGLGKSSSASRTTPQVPRALVARGKGTQQTPRLGREDAFSQRFGSIPAGPQRGKPPAR